MNHYFVFDEFCLDTTNRRLFQENISVYLAPKSYELLELLVSNQGEILKKEEIIEDLWEDNFVEEANLTQHIYLLRKALKRATSKKVYIETFPKIGYRFTANVEELNCERLRLPFPVDFYESNPLIPPILPKKKNRNLIESIMFARSGLLRVVKSHLVSVSAILIILMVTLSVAFYENNREVSISKAQSNPIKSIAVLPFRNIDGAKDQKLGSGLAETLVSRLGSKSHLRIHPVVTNPRFNSTRSNDLSEIGRKLNIDAVLVGSIQCDNDLIRVVVSLYRVEDNRQIWSETYDGRYSNLFALQDKISEEVSQKISSDMETSAINFTNAN